MKNKIYPLVLSIAAGLLLGGLCSALADSGGIPPPGTQNSNCDSDANPCTGNFHEVGRGCSGNTTLSYNYCCEYILLRCDYGNYLWTYRSACPPWSLCTQTGGSNSHVCTYGGTVINVPPPPPGGL